jgi:hypothetical protein
MGANQVTVQRLVCDWSECIHHERPDGDVRHKAAVLDSQGTGNASNRSPMAGEEKQYQPPSKTVENG